MARPGRRLRRLRDHRGQLSFAPWLPSALTRLSFALRWRESKLRVTVIANEASYSLEDGSGTELDLLHHGERFTLTTTAAQTFPIKPLRPLTKRPTQPAGRAPGLRGLSRVTPENQCLPSGVIPRIYTRYTRRELS